MSKRTLDFFSAEVLAHVQPQCWETEKEGGSGDRTTLGVVLEGSILTMLPEISARSSLPA